MTQSFLPVFGANNIKEELDSPYIKSAQCMSVMGEWVLVRLGITACVHPYLIKSVLITQDLVFSLEIW